MKFEHKPVLLKETIDALNINPDGTYVDGTAGGGGHTSEIVKRLNNGKVIAIDQDPDAIKTLSEKFANNSKVIIVKDNFCNIKDVISRLKISKVDGVMLDIGVSSYQLDTTSRGFSYNTDAPLDMRMSKTGISAYDIVNKFSLSQLNEIISKYGEEKFSYRIASNIVKRRKEKEIKTTLELSEIIKASLPQSQKKKQGHPAKKTFQAIRIAVNDELNVLEKGIDNAFDSLDINGRLAVISFHSLEDRIIKQKMVAFSTGCICPPDFPVCVCGHKQRAKLINKKPIVAQESELLYNRRSKSAKLRVCEKIEN